MSRDDLDPRQDRDLQERWARTLLRARERARGTDPDTGTGTDAGRGTGTAPDTGTDTGTGTGTVTGTSDDGDGPFPSPYPYARVLLDRWAEPQRRYHTTAHLTAVLDHIDGHLAPHAADPDLVRLAAWFHDAVYLPERDTNEERSARLAERALPEAGLTRAQADEVARLVRLTVTHAPAPGDSNGQVLCDADLAILASGPEAYAAYASAVREEYDFVPDDAFREGRAAVLRHLLELPRLFHTPYGEAHWEAPARHNLSTELDLLSAG